jgi:large subunit ribosomal protein L24
MVAAAIGMPSRSGAGGTGWSPDPIAWNATGLDGRIAFKAQRAVFAPWLVAQGFSGVVRFNGPEVVFEDVAGELGKGRLDGRLTVANGAAGLTARLRLGLADAELGAIFPSTDRLGNVWPADVADRDRRCRPQPRRFHRSLTASAPSRSNRRGWWASTRRCSAPSRAIELGIPTEDNRIREFVGGALDNAGLPVSKASAVSASAPGRRGCATSSSSRRADLQATVNVDLADAMLDALLTSTRRHRRRRARPAVMVALGDAAGAKRTVDINLLTSWLTLRAVEQQSRQIDAMERACS